VIIDGYTPGTEPTVIGPPAQPSDPAPPPPAMVDIVTSNAKQNQINMVYDQGGTPSGDFR